MEKLAVVTTEDQLLAEFEPLTGLLEEAKKMNDNAVFNYEDRKGNTAADKRAANKKRQGQIRDDIRDWLSENTDLPTGPDCELAELIVAGKVPHITVNF